jgi:general secretion pathway protein G
MQANPETLPTQHDLCAAPTAPEAVALARRARARLARQGMTLIEIMIVVVIMALVATGVGIAVIPQLQKAKVQQTKSAVQTVRSAVALYRATNNADCATMDQLLQDKAIDKSTSTKDSWDNDFRIECDGTDITVTSAGPDKEFETDDDVK